eukprot:9883125-Alexandrium_andersonii.AAC.1
MPTVLRAAARPRPAGHPATSRTASRRWRRSPARTLTGSGAAIQGHRWSPGRLPFSPSGGPPRSTARPPPSGRPS